MTSIIEEAERLARAIKTSIPMPISERLAGAAQLADIVTSGTYAREVERRAYERAAKEADQVADGHDCSYCGDGGGRIIAHCIRALATTPEKEPQP